MTLTLTEKIEAISEDLTSILDRLEELAHEGDHILPLLEDLYALNHLADAVSNSVYGLWSNTVERAEEEGSKPVMKRLLHPNEDEAVRAASQEVMMTLPEKILGSPWEREEIYQLAAWADAAGSGSASDLLWAVAEALAASKEG